jgi:hypothetical protein
MLSVLICQDDTYSMEYMDYAKDQYGFTPLEHDQI